MSVGANHRLERSPFHHNVPFAQQPSKMSNPSEIIAPLEQNGSTSAPVRPSVMQPSSGTVVSSVASTVASSVVSAVASNGASNAVPNPSSVSTSIAGPSSGLSAQQRSDNSEMSEVSSSLFSFAKVF